MMNNKNRSILDIRYLQLNLENLQLLLLELLKKNQTIELKYIFNILIYQLQEKLRLSVLENGKIIKRFLRENADQDNPNIYMLKNFINVLQKSLVNQNMFGLKNQPF